MALADVGRCMSIFHKPLLTDSFLHAVWHEDFVAFRGSQAEEELEARLSTWAKRRDLGETASEAAFIQIFFNEIWFCTSINKICFNIFRAVFFIQF